MKKIIIFAFTVFALSAISVFAQPRPADKDSSGTAKPNPAPQSFSARYEGGLFGYTGKLKGTLNFDDINDRIIFKNEENKEVFSIPYKSLLVIYPEKQSVRSTAGTVVSAIPLPGAGLAGLIKEKRRYLVVQFDDPDSDVRGLTSFKIENKELLDSIIFTLGEKAKMKQRGDAFYRPRTATQSL